MAEASICSSEAEPNNNTLLSELSPPLNKYYLPRTIGFHLAKKPFLGFSNGGSDFKLEILNPTSEPSSSSAIQGHTSEKKSDVPEIFENMLDPELNFGMKVWRIGAGLQNLGNTCFLNSVLQCLTYTEPLAAYLQSGKHQLSCRIAGFCALCAIQKHVSCALQSTGRILAPKDLVSNLRCISRSFRNARQEDAHEYMVNLLDSMHKCSLPFGVSSDTPSAYDKSLVHKIFGGRLRSQVKCLQCFNCTNKFDPFLDLSLEIVNAESLNKALMQFTAPEQLDGGEKQYHCHRCLQKVEALKQMTVYKAPYVLTVHLKRFASHDPGRKIDKKVHFGPTLDLKPFFSGSTEGELKYTLYGVLVHAGWSTHSGHYYCFVRTSTGMWYSLDDNRVIQVNERTVLEQKAYMVFYVRDRKYVTSKYPVDGRKENLGSNTLQDKCSSNTVQSRKESVPPGSSDKKVFEGATFVAPPKEAIIVGSLIEPLLDHAPVLNINCAAKDELSPMAETALLDVKITSGILNAGSSGLNKHELKLSGPLLEPKKVISESGPQNRKCSVKAPVAGTPEPNGCKVNRNFSINPSLSTTNGSENSRTERLISEEISSKVDCIVNESAANGSVIKKGDVGLVKKSSPFIGKCRSFDVIKPRDCKRRVLKFRGASLHLASTIFLSASLSIQKRKNRKRQRSKTLFHQRKKLKSRTDNAVNGSSVGNEDISSCVGFQMEPKNGRMNLNQWGSNEPECIHGAKKCSLQNGSRNISATDLGHTTGIAVPRWDNNGESSLMLEPNSLNLSIGHVLDEWDEEYDRGKQKKVRESKREFGGPNLFQEIASKNAQKKMKRHLIS